MDKALLVIYRSPNGRGDWTPCAPEDVPEFVKEPSTIGRLLAGEACMDCAEGTAGSDWYMAKRAASQSEMNAINRRRKRAAKRVTH